MESKYGACGCGSVTYKITADALNMVNCHCNMCRNHNGSVFSTYVIFPEDAIKISTGDNLLNQYKANEGNKYFCKICGTAIMNSHEKYPGLRMVYLGTLCSPSDIKPAVNIWYENKLDWIEEISEMEAQN